MLVVFFSLGFEVVVKNISGSRPGLYKRVSINFLIVIIWLWVQVLVKLRDLMKRTRFKNDMSEKITPARP